MHARLVSADLYSTYSLFIQNFGITCFESPEQIGVYIMVKTVCQAQLLLIQTKFLEDLQSTI